jgi:hypothetical protein
MIRESYPLNIETSETVFKFDSIGTKGIIKKIICFENAGDDYWNLGFGDETENDWSDVNISNNGDIFKVMETVAQATLIFSNRFPERIIVINPVDFKRKRLYNSIFRRRNVEISALFTIYASLNDDFFEYRAKIEFDFFLLVKK